MKQAALGLLLYYILSIMVKKGRQMLDICLKQYLTILQHKRSTLGYSINE